MNEETLINDTFEKFLKENGYETGCYVDNSLIFKAFKKGFEEGKKQSEGK